MKWRLLEGLIVNFLLMIHIAFSMEIKGEETDLCTIMQSPRKYSGSFVSVWGRLDQGDGSEWYLTNNGCVYPGPNQELLLPDSVLVMTPYQVKPRPNFQLSIYGSDPVALLYMQGNPRGFSLHAKFEGRIDWSGMDTKPGERIRPKSLYGREKVSWRMILYKVSESSLNVIPKY